MRRPHILLAELLSEGAHEPQPPWFFLEQTGLARSVLVGWSTLSPLTYHQWPFSLSAFVPACFGGPPILALGLWEQQKVC